MATNLKANAHRRSVGGGHFQPLQRDHLEAKICDFWGDCERMLAALKKSQIWNAGMSMGER